MSNFTVNFYEVLGVESNASIKEIKKQYSKLIVKYHPDKVKDALESNFFELIQKAYETIGSEEKRQEYDFFLKNIQNIKGNDWYSLKTNYDKFKKLDEIQPANKNAVQIEFDKVFKEYDLKHGIDRNKLDEKFDKDEITNKLDDLVLQREQDEIEFSQNTIFKEDENFDISKFNAAYDVYKTSYDKQIIKQSNVMPYNFDSTNISSSSSKFNDLNVYDSTFNEDNNFEGNNLYSNINVGKTNRLDKEKVKNIKPVEYTLSHNKLENNYEDKIKKKLEERDIETQNFDNMKYQDFNNEDKVFQFSHDIGITENMLDWTEHSNNNEDLLKACIKLIESEKIK